MKIRVRLATLMVLASLLFLTISCTKNEAPLEPEVQLSGSSPELSWEHDWDTAFELAASRNQPVLVNFYADWCIWCKRLDSTTFSDPAVASLLSNSVVGLRVKIDGNGGPYATTYQVFAPPTLLLLDSAGQELARIPGYMPPLPLLERLRGFLPVPAPGRPAPQR